MSRGRSRAILAACVLLVGASQASAQSTQTFMLVPGIPGDSTVEGYKDWIDVFSITQAFTAASKGAAACTLDIGKGIDSAGPKLWAAAVTGQVFSTIQIDILKAAEKPFKFYEIVLTNARLTTVSSMPDQLVERLTLSSEGVELKFTMQNPDGSPGSTPITAKVSCK